MEIIEERIAKIDEAIENAIPGTEEHERLVNSQAALIKANADDKKANSEVELKKGETKRVVLNAGIGAAAMLLVGIIKEGLKYITNKRALKTEETDVVNSVTYNNR